MINIKMKIIEEELHLTCNDRECKYEEKFVGGPDKKLARLIHKHFSTFPYCDGIINVRHTFKVLEDKAG